MPQEGAHEARTAGLGGPRRLGPRPRVAILFFAFSFFGISLSLFPVALGFVWIFALLWLRFFVLFVPCFCYSRAGSRRRVEGVSMRLVSQYKQTFRSELSLSCSAGVGLDFSRRWRALSLFSNRAFRLRARPPR